MSTYNMTCTCGDTLSVEAPSREEAVSMLQAGMTQEAVDAHLSEKHAGDAEKPNLGQVHAMIDQMVAAV